MSVPRTRAGPKGRRAGASCRGCRETGRADRSSSGAGRLHRDVGYLRARARPPDSPTAHSGSCPPRATEVIEDQLEVGCRWRPRRLRQKVRRISAMAGRRSAAGHSQSTMPLVGHLLCSGPMKVKRHPSIPGAASTCRPRRGSRLVEGEVTEDRERGRDARARPPCRARSRSIHACAA